MAWTTLSFTSGNILTSTSVQQLYENFTAVAYGESGAPKMQPSNAWIKSIYQEEEIVVARVAGTTNTPAGALMIATDATAYAGAWSIGIYTPSSGYIHNDYCGVFCPAIFFGVSSGQFGLNNGVSNLSGDANFYIRRLE